MKEKKRGEGEDYHDFKNTKKKKIKESKLL